MIKYTREKTFVLTFLSPCHFLFMYQLSYLSLLLPSICCHSDDVTCSNETLGLNIFYIIFCYGFVQSYLLGFYFSDKNIEVQCKRNWSAKMGMQPLPKVRRIWFTNDIPTYIWSVMAISMFLCSSCSLHRLLYRIHPLLFC